MATFTSSRRYWVTGIIIIVGLFVLRLSATTLPWPYIAATLALIGTLLTVLAEQRRAFGDSYQSPESMNEPAKVAARKWARRLTPIALALILFSSLLPVLELPDKSDLIRVDRSIQEVTFPAANGEQRLNPDKLKSVLADLQTRIVSIGSTNPGMGLLVQNCGTAVECACPSEYEEVPDSGEWNLNHKAPGSSIRLCSRRATQ